MPDITDLEKLVGFFTAQGSRITWANGKSSIKDGPFTESKELVAGFWLAAIMPQRYEIGALHITFIGGIGLIILVMSMRVVTSHGGVMRCWPRRPVWPRRPRR